MLIQALLPAGHAAPSTGKSFPFLFSFACIATVCITFLGGTPTLLCAEHFTVSDTASRTCLLHSHRNRAEQKELGSECCGWPVVAQLARAMGTEPQVPIPGPGNGWCVLLNLCARSYAPNACVPCAGQMGFFLASSV